MPYWQKENCFWMLWNVLLWFTLMEFSCLLCPGYKSPTNYQVMDPLLDLSMCWEDGHHEIITLLRSGFEDSSVSGKQTWQLSCTHQYVTKTDSNIDNETQQCTHTHTHAVLNNSASTIVAVALTFAQSLTVMTLTVIHCANAHLP